MPQSTARLMPSAASQLGIHSTARIWATHAPDVAYRGRVQSSVGSWSPLALRGRCCCHFTREPAPLSAHPPHHFTPAACKQACTRQPRAQVLPSQTDRCHCDADSRPCGAWMWIPVRLAWPMRGLFLGPWVPASLRPLCYIHTSCLVLLHGGLASTPFKPPSSPSRRSSVCPLNTSIIHRYPGRSLLPTYLSLLSHHRHPAASRLVHHMP